MMSLEPNDAIHCRKRKRRVGEIVTGLLLILLGCIAIAQSFSDILESIRIFGCLFIIGGGLLWFYAYQSRESGQFALKLLICIIHLLTGSLLLINPLQGALTLTLVLGITTFVQGVIQTILAFQIRPEPNWSWVLLSGIVSVIFGILIGSRTSFNNDFIFRLLVSSVFSLQGVWILMLAVVARSNPK
ncbi:MAG TPA: DUF308 domain-containing protein [Coleofasciculaceae cyanobacterium]